MGFRGGCINAFNFRSKPEGDFPSCARYTSGIIHVDSKWDVVLYYYLFSRHLFSSGLQQIWKTNVPRILLKVKFNFIVAYKVPLRIQLRLTPSVFQFSFVYTLCHCWPSQRRNLKFPLRYRKHHLSPPAPPRRRLIGPSAITSSSQRKRAS